MTTRQETPGERLVAVTAELQAIREDLDTAGAASFADVQLLAFGTWVMDLLGFEGEDAYDHVGEARALLVQLIAKPKGPRHQAVLYEEDREAAGSFPDIFADEPLLEEV